MKADTDKNSIPSEVVLIPIEPKIDSTFTTLLLIIFCEQVAAGALLALIPFQVTAMGGSAWHLAWLMTAYSIMSLFSEPVAGWLSDRFGRRPVLLLNLLMSTVALVVFAFASSLFIIFLSRLLAGAFSSNSSTARAYTADATLDFERAKRMSVVESCETAGSLIGPTVVALLSSYGYFTTFSTCIILNAIILIGAYFKLKDPPASLEALVARSDRAKFDFLLAAKQLRDTRIRWVVTLLSLSAFAMAQAQVAFILFVENRFGYDAGEIARIFILMGVTSFIMEAWVFGKLAERWGEKSLIRFGAVLNCAAFMIFTWSMDVSLTIASLVLSAFAGSLLFPSFFSLALKYASPEHRGVVAGLLQGMCSLVGIFALPMAGWAFDRLGMDAPFLFGAAALAICSLFAMIGTPASDQTIN